MSECICPVCKSKGEFYSQTHINMNLFDCPICGRFELSEQNGTREFNLNHLASYLVYHSYKYDSKIEYRYNTVLDKEDCDRYRKEFQNGNNVCGLPVHIDSDIIELWFPKSLSERVDCILKYFDSHIEHLGQRTKFSLNELMSVLFIDRFNIEKRSESNTNNQERECEECLSETNYMLEYLQETNLIDYLYGDIRKESIIINLTPKGYQRIDELQKNTSNGRSALVAMKFGDETKKLREAIRKGVGNAGYIAVFIDEVQHNDFITPELLKHIRDSKFVVVDLTHLNNGAYFEEGYAMGLGKEVIQLCQKDVKLHFDIAQKNTIIWNTEEDIPIKLTNRIKATVD